MAGECQSASMKFCTCRSLFKSFICQNIHFPRGCCSNTVYSFRMSHSHQTHRWHHTPMHFLDVFICILHLSRIIDTSCVRFSFCFTNWWTQSLYQKKCKELGSLTCKTKSITCVLLYEA